MGVNPCEQILLLAIDRESQGLCDVLKVRFRFRCQSARKWLIRVPLPALLLPFSLFRSTLILCLPLPLLLRSLQCLRLLGPCGDRNQKCQVHSTKQNALRSVGRSGGLTILIKVKRWNVTQIHCFLRISVAGALDNLRFGGNIL